MDKKDLNIVVPSTRKQNKVKPRLEPETVTGSARYALENTSIYD